jgi:hypothetical protein
VVNYAVLQLFPHGHSDTRGIKAVSASEEDKEEKDSEKIKDNGATATDLF